MNTAIDGFKITDKYQLIGMAHSYFTGKVRSYLRLKNIPFDEVHANKDVCADVLVPKVLRVVFPVVCSPTGQFLEDSTIIIDDLEREFPENPIYPTGAKQKLAGLLIELWADEWFPITAMHYRWNHNREWAWETFGAVLGQHSSIEAQREAGNEFSRYFRESITFLGVSPRTWGGIEKSYHDLLGELENHFSNYPFLLGARPSIGDFGLIGALYAHMTLDPATRSIMERLAPKVLDWVNRMHNPTEPLSGSYLPNDEIPHTLMPILARVMREQMPVLQETAVIVSEWKNDHPGKRIPRCIGRHNFWIEGHPGRRAVFPYSLWMLQRPLDHYHSLKASERESTDKLLDQIGGDVFRSIIVRDRIVMKDYWPAFEEALPV